MAARINISAPGRSPGRSGRIQVVVVRPPGAAADGGAPDAPWREGARRRRAVPARPCGSWPARRFLAASGLTAASGTGALAARCGVQTLVGSMHGARSVALHDFRQQAGSTSAASRVRMCQPSVRCKCRARLLQGAQDAAIGPYAASATMRVTEVTPSGPLIPASASKIPSQALPESLWSVYQLSPP